MKTMETAASILLILTGDDPASAVQAAFQQAQTTSKPLHVLQILTSDLYRFGHQDLVATRPSKKDFLLHIRNEVLERGKTEVRALEDAAHERGISLEIVTVEAEDIVSASLDEARKGYQTIYLPKQPKGLFPLFKTSLANCLKKKTSSKIISC